MVGTEIWFYHLQSRPLARALPVLVEKSLARGWNAVIQAVTEERIGALDELLWTYSEESFLAHGTLREGDPQMQPVYLTVGTENPNGAAIRFCVEGAAIISAATSADPPYERLILVFDGNDPDQLEDARVQWRSLKGQGYSLAYWQEGDNGRWERKG